MTKFNPMFEYPVLERIDGGLEGRKYKIPSGRLLPSVTTILKGSQDQSFLIEWSKRIGASKALQISKESAALGSLMHKYIEKTLLGEEFKPGSNLIHKMAMQMAINIIDNGMKDMTEFVALESHLYDEVKGYAGTVDLIGVYDGQLTIIDFKNSIKIKKSEHIEGYRMQLAAYAQAHNRMFGTQIRSGRVLMSARPKDGEKPEFKAFIVEGDEFESSLKKWNKIVEDYYNKPEDNKE